ncbi:DUF2953 domain-containing protein [Thermaerobacter litoralis]
MASPAARLGDGRERAARPGPLALAAAVAGADERLLGAAALALAAVLVALLLLHPLLPVRLRGRWRHGRLTLALQVGWTWLAYRHRLSWRPPGPMQLRRSWRLPPIRPGRRSIGYRRQILPRPSWPWPLAVLPPARQFLRIVTAGRWRLRHLRLEAKAGLPDAAATAWLAGGLWALAGAAAAAASRDRARGPLQIRIEPAFDHPQWSLDFDCIALVPLWEAMSAARALAGTRRRAGPAGAGRGR